MLYDVTKITGIVLNIHNARVIKLPISGYRCTKLILIISNQVFQ